MTNRWALSWGALATALACAGAGCKGTLTGGMGDFGTGGGGGSLAPAAGIPLVASATGFVDDPVSGVIGAWYPYGDGVGPDPSPTNAGDGANSDCQLTGGFPASDCSQIDTPTPGEPFRPDDITISKMCTAGTAARVLPDSTGNPDYADLWGAGIGFDFNNAQVDGGRAGYFDMSPYRGIAFTFSADVLPVGAMRVNFLFEGMRGGDAPYWMGATSEASPLTGTTAQPQQVVINWTDVAGPLYLTQLVPPVDPSQYPFNPRVVQAIQFQVFTNAVTTTPYSFCVSNMQLILNQ